MTPKTKTASMLAAFGLTMLSLSFAAVPFYDWFCRTTGYGGATITADQGSDVILDQTMLIRFDASLEAGMPWEFKPQQTEMTVRIGETNLAFYEAYNPTDHPIAGTASYNVQPDMAGGYFTKIECFCFSQQVLQPGERLVMPVSFFVDPTMVDNPEAGLIKEITLSYTFHTTPLPEAQAALAPAPGNPVN